MNPRTVSPEKGLGRMESFSGAAAPSQIKGARQRQVGRVGLEKALRKTLYGASTSIVRRGGGGHVPRKPLWFGANGKRALVRRDKIGFATSKVI